MTLHLSPYRSSVNHCLEFLRLLNLGGTLHAHFPGLNWRQLEADLDTSERVNIVSVGESFQ